jgi:hypothetical protein
MPPGGYRQGTPGQAYPQRTDLAADTQPVRSPKTKVQGDRKRREDAQRIMPLSRQPPTPGSLTPLTAPTERPGEPIQAGLPMGPGAGPSSMIAPTGGTDALFDVRALAAAYPEYSDGLMKIIDWAEQNM